METMAAHRGTMGSLVWDGSKTVRRFPGAIRRASSSASAPATSAKSIKRNKQTSNGRAESLAERQRDRGHRFTEIGGAIRRNGEREGDSRR
jgi:hypothetical protein